MIIVIDTEPPRNAVICATLTDEGYSAIAYVSGNEAYTIMAKENHSV
jgi:DNA-binding response OmpR family regulator